MAGKSADPVFSSQVVYDPKLFSDVAMRSMRDSFAGLVAFSNSETEQLGDLFSLPKYFGVPPVETAGSDFVPVHQMFQLHAGSNPDQVALLCEESGEAMTYGELDVLSTIRAKGKNPVQACKRFSNSDYGKFFFLMASALSPSSFFASIAGFASWNGYWPYSSLAAPTSILIQSCLPIERRLF